MDKNTYDAHTDALRRGQIVEIGGRTAFDPDQLDFVIKASGDTLPDSSLLTEPQSGILTSDILTDEAGDQEPGDINHDGNIDDLEKMPYAELQVFGATLGVKITNNTGRAKAIAMIHEAQAGK